MKSKHLMPKLSMGVSVLYFISAGLVNTGKYWSSTQWSGIRLHSRGLSNSTRGPFSAKDLQFGVRYSRILTV